MSRVEATAAVYVHVPWCLQRCPYCDFATEAINPRNIPHEPYADAVISELEIRAREAMLGPIDTVFFGGGTPSLWDVASLGRVLAAIVRTFGGTPREVTVECNPTSLDEARAAELEAVGVTRISLGVQSLRAKHLRYLGRLHDSEQAERALRAAASRKNLRVTADLMFGMPDQTADELVEDMTRLVDLGAKHLSAYALTIEPATRFGELARKGKLPKLPDDAVASLFEAADVRAAQLGLEHYEVSNYAGEGQRGLHNEHYWRGDDYVGLGAGAVGCTTRDGNVIRYKNVYDVPSYIDAGARRERPREEPEELTTEDRVREGLMLGLRTIEGVSLRELEARIGVDPRRGRERAIEKAVRRGWLVDDGDRLVIPKERWLVADDIVSSIF
ncbi:MAG: radical SAM family heme chaperone HemW [Myxococcales bacterium]|nr:radical SAM family heme chaperone HemW [Myxococcales bacterium]